MKQCVVVLNANNKPLGVFEVKIFKDDKAYLELKSQAEKNLFEEASRQVALEKEVRNLKKEIEILKVENRYDRGEITKDEMINQINVIKESK